MKNPQKLWNNLSSLTIIEASNDLSGHHDQKDPVVSYSLSKIKLCYKQVSLGGNSAGIGSDGAGDSVVRWSVRLLQGRFLKP